MSDPLMEIAEFAGKASGTIVKDVADFSKPLAGAFRRGWRAAMEEKPKTEPAAEQAPDSA